MCIRDSMTTEWSLELRAFAVGMTVISSMAAGLGGVVVALIGDVRHDSRRIVLLLNFSLGVMLHISLRDIQVGTTEVIGSGYAGVAFFLGMAGFLGLVCIVPEADIASFVLGKSSKEADRAHKL
eukprot:TRINITY_DN18450_c0_g1_i1.p2 TRINITY_DN18450_c0_g1~~TRINITY_DN18450_c0_g1_i1.p2  ORF type:complete len:124 (+),score=32.46 TRINITY_DN18450_c0_g1_i1:184-555(+)